MSLPNVTVTEAPTSRRLCTSAQVSPLLPAKSAAEVDRLILVASLAIAGPDGLNRRPWLVSVTEEMAGAGGRYLFPSVVPIHSVTEVSLQGDVVDSEDYSIRGDRLALYQEGGWVCSPWDVGRVTGGRPLDYQLTYRAGWVMPDDVGSWAASTAVAQGQWVESSEDSALIFEAQTAGDTGGAEPVWPTAVEGEVVDNEVTWKAFPQRLPEDVEEAAVVTAVEWGGGGLSVPSGIESESFETASIRYRDPAKSGAMAIPPHAAALLRSYRDLVAA